MKFRYLSLCGLLLCLSFATVSAQEMISADSLSGAILKIDVEEELIQENEQLRQAVDSLSRQLYSYQHNVLPVIDDPYYEIKLYQLLYTIETAKNAKDAGIYKRFGEILAIDSTAKGELERLYIRSDSFYLNESYVDKKSLKYRLFRAIERKAFMSTYPATSLLIIRQKLVLEDTVRVIHQVNPVGVRRIEFPQLSSKVIPLAEKQKKAEQLLNFIMTISGKEPFERYSFLTYQSLEKKEVPNNDINRLLKIRYSYILYLKKQYEKM
ncbi:hypothetical protein [Chitinophaga filiformis]|uniref:Uncharacterized protein n=1 Tax=Chitinophaga filiformis TaxID=104663 RepID=A0A1G7M0Y5_CHIFI|nr:hypothetical protein [Chitinophaga filiformis]SDF55465.1 hypothetical protein SAMN04488121_102255 [Chitinophaga filiformis]